MTQHIEFFDNDHFQFNYHRVAPTAELTDFIDFFWETSFEHLWTKYPDGFSDTLFPNIGYTYLINLGTSFTMQLDDKLFDMKTDGFLPRPTSIECFHRPGNHLFGIKFKISPVLLEKKINFSEYRDFISPLTFLIDKSVVQSVKSGKNFKERVNILSAYFLGILQRFSGSLQPVHIVREILNNAFETNDFSTPVEEIAGKYSISGRTLQRYFESTTSISSKKALQIMRIRKAVAHLASSPRNFHYSIYGYYDHSHFYKHLKSFLRKDTLNAIKPHLLLLEKLHQSSK